MRISVFGLGYVGCVSAACFADRGHDVIGFDIHRAKVDKIKAGIAPIIELELGGIIARTAKAGSLTATHDSEAAIFKSDVSFICVGTPSNDDGSLDLRYVENACREIGSALAKKNSFHNVVIRSTVLPGALRQTVIPILERQTGWKAGEDFGVCSNPEFMREGSAIQDFLHPAKTVIGATDERSEDMLQELDGDLPGKMIRCPIEIAEMTKYSDNAWHAMKVSFANEIGRLCKAMSIDSHQVMDIFCANSVCQPWKNTKACRKPVRRNASKISPSRISARTLKVEFIWTTSIGAVRARRAVFMGVRNNRLMTAVKDSPPADCPVHRGGVYGSPPDATSASRQMSKCRRQRPAPAIEPEAITVVSRREQAGLRK